MSAFTIQAFRSSSALRGIRRSFGSSAIGRAAVNSSVKGESLPWMSSILYTTALTVSTTTTMTLCESNDNDQDFISKIKSTIESSSLTSPEETMNALLSAIGSTAQSAFDSGVPTNLSYGFFAGYVSGLALKKLGRIASVSLGVAFLGLQGLAYSGYINVNHDKIAYEVEKILDRNKDGKVDVEDLKGVIDDVKSVAGYGLENGGGGKKEGELLVSGSGFGLGFYGGLRSG